jgi:hypothetical protein
MLGLCADFGYRTNSAPSATSTPTWSSHWSRWSASRGLVAFSSDGSQIHIQVDDQEEDWRSPNHESFHAAITSLPKRQAALEGCLTQPTTDLIIEMNWAGTQTGAHHEHGHQGALWGRSPHKR